jgi:hypothetical protein
VSGRKFSRLFSLAEFFCNFFRGIFPDDFTRAGIFPETGSIVPAPGIFSCRDFMLLDL